MSLLEELIDIPLDQISDEELEEAVMKGRVAREYKEPPKARKTAKTVEVVDYSDYD